MRAFAYSLLFYIWMYPRVIATSNLLSAVEKVAGVFQPGHEPQSGSLDLRKTVLMTVANYGYLNHLQNFVCFTERLHMKPLIVSMEAKTHAYISNNTNLVSHLFNISPYTPDSIDTEGAPWLSKQFVLLTNLKIAIQIEILKIGYNVIFADTDVAIVHNPIPHLFWKNVDYVHSVNAPCDMYQVWDFFWNPHEQVTEGNSGFHFIRANNRTIRLFEGSFKYHFTNWPGLGDQEVLWQYIRRTHDPPQMPIGKCHDVHDNETVVLFNSTYHVENLVSCSLDNCMFSSGMINGRDRHGNTRYSYLKNNLRLMKEEMYAVHANWIVGNKKKENALRQAGLWIAKDWRNNQFGTKNCIPFEEKEGDPVPPQHTPKHNVNGQREVDRQHQLHQQHKPKQPPQHGLGQAPPQARLPKKEGPHPRRRIPPPAPVQLIL